MDKVYIIETANSDLDSKLKEFQEQLQESQQIIHQTAIGSKLIVTVRETKKSRRNLLLEEHGPRMK